MPHTLRLGEIPDRVFTTWLEKTLLFLIVVLLALTVALLSNQMEIKDAQKASAVRGYVNRAVSCRVLVGLGLKIERDDDCRDPKVTKFYNPDADPVAGSQSIGQRYNRELLCSILDALGASRTDCTSVSG